EVKARAVRLVNDHQGEYASLTAAAAVVVKQFGVGPGGGVEGAVGCEAPEDRRGR
ncbi:MAG: hypothetical protein QOH03_5216, partial [Kribbellaceae bacterium]|nr:hypothetical protein [Kribbellaceae bacterium]